MTLLTPTLASNTTVTTTTTATQTLTRIVDIFFLNQPAYEGLPYTMFHRDSGSVVAVDNVNNLTTYVVTTTQVDRRTTPSATRTDNVTTAIPTLKPTRSRHWRPLNGTGDPSTITQGPATAMFTGTGNGPGRTMYLPPCPFLVTLSNPIIRQSPVNRLTAHSLRNQRINRCSLNGTVEAACNLTHVGDMWYTKNTEWNGTYSTYSFNWTSGDRFGFAPVTITEGAELLTGPSPTPSGASNAAWSVVRGGPAREAVVVQGAVLGVILMVGVGFVGLGA
ncbi:hypothetical protein MMYC01_207071 [Madurella mycetomatis]|uniref:Uncharacterized protein n=1 Tax=Madurella mycetomatis TaxID=100816 RepID=A0A175VYN0_9PEZI|nr:hypothetical protein MMYC01_207071 [Madurella mycetomatis]